jgi:hypothetical protein
VGRYAKPTQAWADRLGHGSYPHASDDGWALNAAAKTRHSVENDWSTCISMHTCLYIAINVCQCVKRRKIV